MINRTGNADEGKEKKEINKLINKPNISHNKGNIKNALMPHNHKESQISNAEKRITKTLAIIMSCFTCCWLPFFIIYIVRAILTDPDANNHFIPEYVMDIFIWLGYLNSSLNPIIYLIVNVNFRNSLADVFRCKNNKNFTNNQINNKVVRL